MRRARCSGPVLTGPVSTITYEEFSRREKASYPSFQSDEDMLGSWLSSITGIHINPLDLGATKIDLGQAARTVGAIASAATGNVVAAGGLITQNIKNSGLLTPSTPSSSTALVAPASTPYAGTLPTIDYTKNTATLNGITVDLATYNQQGIQAFQNVAQQLATVNVTATPNPWLLVAGAVLVMWAFTPSKHKVAEAA